MIYKEPSCPRSKGIKDRTKHGRLHGADLYVARLGPNPSSPADASAILPTDSASKTQDNSIPIPCTGSLHDEIINWPVKETANIQCTTAHTEQPLAAAMSRPCYRCISYMASAGIKRVFWTTGSSGWEGAKVRDLFDAFDGLGPEQSPDTTVALNNVFVTKHEVLKLRKLIEGG